MTVETPETPETDGASTSGVPALLLAAAVVAAVLGAGVLFLGTDDTADNNDVLRGVPSGINVELVASADLLGEETRGISQDGLAALFIRDGQLCRLTIATGEVDCLGIDDATRVAITPGAGVWSTGAGPIVEDRGVFLRSPRVLDFDAGTANDPFDDGIIRRPLDINGERLLQLEENLLVITDLDGRERERIAALDSSFVYAGHLEGEVAVIANSDPDNGLVIERHAPEATVRVPIDSAQGIALDVTSDLAHAIALDLDARNFLRAGALVLVDFESRSATTLNPPSELDPLAFGNVAWFSPEGDVIYAVFYERSVDRETLVAATLEQDAPTGGELEWSIVASWSTEDQASPDSVFSLAGIPNDGVGFIFIDDGGVYRMTPTYDN